MNTSHPSVVAGTNTGWGVAGNKSAWLQCARSGAAQGVRTWVAYWLIECFCWTLWPWLNTPSYDYEPTHPWLPVAALGVYMLAGAALGIAMALVLVGVAPGSAQCVMPRVGPLSLAIAIGALALANAQHIQLFIAVALIGVSFSRAAWAETLRSSINAWSTPAMLLAYPFATTQIDSPATGRVIGITAVIVVFLASYIAARRLWKRAPRNEGGTSRHARAYTAWAGLVGIFIALPSVLKQQPILTVPSGITAGPATDGLPNVILISLDTVRADHLSVYGYSRDTTPNLRKFAQDATVFNNAISAGDMTLSSHASMFTGLYASQHGAHWALGQGRAGVALGTEFGLRLPENSRTLAGILAAKGYRTVGIAANRTYLQHAFRLDQGFEYYSQPDPVLFPEKRDRCYLRTNLCRLIGRFLPRSISDLAYVRAGDINRQAFQLLRPEKADKRPLFLFLNYMDGHQPYFPPAPYNSRYPGEDPAFSAAQYWDTEYGVLRKARMYTARERQRDESQYDGAIAYIDANLNALFQKLKDLGLYDNSLIIITADHGQSFGEKQLLGHGSSTYQEQVYVPLIVKYPGTPQARVRNDRVSHVDLFPTILDVLGEKIPTSLPGHSLRAPAANTETVFSESFPCDMLVSLNPRFRRVERAAFSGPFKLILATNGKREFYDLSQDPHEEHNLYSQNLPAASRLEHELRQWISRLPAERSRPAVMDKSGVDRLKSLGYVQ